MNLLYLVLISQVLLMALIFIFKRTVTGIIDHSIKKDLEIIKTKLSEKQEFKKSVGKKKADLYPEISGQCYEVKNLCRDLLKAIKDKAIFDAELFNNLSQVLVELKQTLYHGYALLKPDLYPIIHCIKKNGLNFHINFDVLSGEYSVSSQEYESPLEIPKGFTRPKDAAKELVHLEEILVKTRNRLKFFSDRLKEREVTCVYQHIDNFSTIFCEDQRVTKDLVNLLKDQSSSIEDVVAKLYEKYKSKSSLFNIYFGIFIKVVFSEMVKEYGHSKPEERVTIELSQAGKSEEDDKNPHILRAKMVRANLLGGEERFLSLYDKLQENYKKIENQFEKMNEIIAKELDEKVV